MSYENQYASKGVAGTALGLGAGALGAIALGGLNGNGFNLFGNGCSDDHCVNRYEAGKDARIAELETEVKLRDANIYTDQKLNNFRNYVDGQFDKVNDTLCRQAIRNQETADAFKMVESDIKYTKNDLYCAINRERDERCCGDNSIVTYANATFYPKQVADVTVGTETTPQPTYNPVYNCGNCGCRNH